jgi:hypothetical protein
MHCTNCSYPLWDISARTCPECGEGFNPANYDFPPCGVRFCCPACDQAYYGTTRQGQLNPAEFACAGCGAPMSAAVAVVRLKPDASEPKVNNRILPWLRRSRLGFGRAWLETFTQSNVSQQTLMDHTPPQSSLRDAALYSLVTIILWTMPPAVGDLVMSNLSNPSLSGVADMVTKAGLMIGGVLAAAGSIFVMLLVWIVTTHATLWLTGGSRWPIRRTAHALFYSTGANAIIIFSMMALCFGIERFLLLILSVFAFFCWAIMAARMLSYAQETPRWRAYLATLMVPVLALALVISNMRVAPSLAARANAARANAATVEAEQRRMDQPILSLFSEIHMAQRRLRRWPAHAMEIPQLTNRIYLPMLVHSDKDELFAGITARELLAMDLEAQRAKVESFTTSLPDRVLAVRVGPAVTLYHGLEQSSPPGVWLLLRVIDDRVEAITGQNVVSHYEPHEFAGALATQNARRAAAGLPPLPKSVIDLKPGEHIAWPEE